MSMNISNFPSSSTTLMNTSMRSRGKNYSTAGPVRDMDNISVMIKLAMVSHINRAVTIEGAVTKHKRALNPHGPHTVPRSLDGYSRASAEYLLIAYICHRGPTHDTGHYFTILVYKDLMWIADDGGTPKVLPFLTPQLAGQIAQVWGIQTSALVTPRQIARALPAPETPDYDPPLHGTPPKKAKFSQDKMRLHVANITSFGRHTLDADMLSDIQLTAIQAMKGTMVAY